jgi:hypothetical protein
VANADESPAELRVSDPGQLSRLQEWLAATGQVRIGRVPGRPGPGEQGAVDVLMVLASSSGLVAALKTVPAFIRSRRSGFHIEMSIHGEKFVLDATNADKDIQRIVEKLVGD